MLWETGPIYAASDFPQLPRRYSKPTSKPAEKPSMMNQPLHPVARHSNREPEDMVQFRLNLMEMCLGLDLATIPPELRQMVAGRTTNGEVPLRILRERVNATENQGGRELLNEQQHQVHEAGRRETQNQETTRVPTPRSRTEPIIPNLTLLFKEDQPGETCGPRQHVVTNPASQETVLLSGDRRESQVPQKRKDKKVAVFEKGQQSNPMPQDNADQPIVFQAQKGIVINEPNQPKPQKIIMRGKGGGPIKPQLRSQPAVTSRHTRARDLIGKQKISSRQAPHAGQLLVKPGHR